jgi:hypothetical protein
MHFIGKSLNPKQRPDDNLPTQPPIRLLNMDLTSDMGARSSSESSMVSSTFGDSNTADFNEDTEYLIRNEQKPVVRYTTRQMLHFISNN